MAPLSSSITLSRPKAVSKALPARIPAPMETAASITIQITVNTSMRTPVRTCAARLTLTLITLSPLHKLEHQLGRSYHRCNCVLISHENIRGGYRVVEKDP